MKAPLSENIAGKGLFLCILDRLGYFLTSFFIDDKKEVQDEYNNSRKRMAETTWHQQACWE
jgi:hypothetical protein